MAGRLALAALVTLLVAQAGCATRLDFDAVSAGRDAGNDTHVGLDAASEPASEAGARGQADAEEAGRVPLDDEHGEKPPDAGATMIGDAAKPDSGDYLADAFTPVNDASLDPALFSCAKLTPAADFCDEFEATDVDLQDAIVIDPGPTAAGSIGRDDHAAAAGRGSLLAVVQPQVPTCFQCDLSVCLYSRPFDLSGHKLLSIEFDMRVEEIDRSPDHRAAVFQFYFGSAERGYSQHTLQLQANGDGLEAGLIELDTDGDVDGHSGARSTPISYGWQPTPLWEWVHVKYALDALDTNASGNKVYVSIRTWSPAAGAEERVLANASLTYSLRYHNPVFELGFPIVDQHEFAEGETNGSWKARFDNVLVRIEAR